MASDPPKDLLCELAYLQDIPERNTFEHELTDRLRANRPDPDALDLSNLAELPSPSTGEFGTRLTTSLSLAHARLTKEDFQAALAAADASAPTSEAAPTRRDARPPLHASASENATSSSPLDTAGRSPSWVRPLLVLLAATAAAGAVGAALGWLW